MRLRVVYYGHLKQDVGTKEETLEVGQDRLLVRELGTLLEGRYPALQGRMDAVAYAVDDELVAPDHVLRDGDRAALLPPVSGG